MFCACYPIPEEKGSCILYCDPDDCLFLDEEKCECIKDLECIREKYYGVDTRYYKCEGQDGGIWCSALTGDSLKIWEYVYAYDTIQNDTIYTVLEYIIHYGDGNIFGADIPNGLHQYRTDHIYIRCWEDDSSLLCSSELNSWHFDNLVQPEKIWYTINYRSQSYKPFELERTIIKLSPDTLITTWDEGKFPGWVLLIPYDG